MATIAPRDLTEEASPAASAWLIVDTGTEVRKTAIEDVIAAGRPLASQAEAETGTDAVKAMTPLTTKQSIAFEVGDTLQAYSANLDEYATVNPTAAGLALLDDTDAAAQRTTLGLGTAAVKNTGTSGDAVPLLDGVNIWSGAQTITSASAGATLLKLESTEAGAVGGPQLDLDRNSASPAANDVAGIIRFLGRDSGGNATPYGNINATVLDPTDGSEDGRLILQVPVAGAQTSAVSIANGLLVGAATGSYQGTGTVNATDYYRNGTALSSTLFGVAVGDASGNLKALNADGGFTFATTATTVNVSGAFGGTWKTAHRFYSSDAATFAGSRTTGTFMRAATGSGTNGPSRADYALHVEASKTNYLTSVVQGEIDGMNIVVRQGTLGDVGAILVNAQQVQNSTYGLTSYEAAAAIINSSGVKQNEMKVTLGGWLQGATDLRGGGFGVLVRPSDDGFSIDHGILILGQSSAASTGVETAIRASSTLAEADTYFMVTGDEHADGAGRVYALGAPIFLNETAIPANGTTGAGIMLSSTTNFGVFFGSGAPTLSAAKGSLYLRSDGTTTNNRAYINTNGSTAWTALTTAA